MKKFLLTLCIVAMLICTFAIISSAETPAKYIEFGAKFPGSNDYITVYTENAESTSNPRIDFAAKKFYSDIDFTNEVDMSTAIGIDFSVTKTYVNGAEGNAVTRMVKPSSPFVNCVEVKWFLAGMPTVSYNGAFFKGWTSLKYFDFGNATAIADNTFEGCGLESITIPSTISSIGGSAFKDCLSLKSVKFEGNITKYGNGSTFYGCTALESVDLGNSMTLLWDSMFSKCTSLKNITIPSTVTEIKGYVFNECKALTSLTIPEGVTKIGNGAFYKAGILSLHIPASVTSLGYQVAEESAIKSLTFAPNSSLTFIDHRAFMNCDSLEGTVILPDGLVEIDYGLFSGSAKLKAVKMPDSVTTLSGGTSLFSSCTSLEYVQFSKNITSICKSMFEGCTSLKAISLPDNITSIGYKALRGCTKLQAVYLPASLTSLGQSSGNSANDWGVFYQSTNVYLVNEPFDVFDGDTLLDDNFVMPSKPDVYYMPKNMTVLGNSEFQGCNNLNSVIVFPEGITSAADCPQGAFFCANRSNPVTVVFLGDMTALNIRQNDKSYSNLSFVFANPNDKSLNDVVVTIGSANNGYQVNSYAYFCAGNVVYDLGTFKASNGTKHTVLGTEFTKTENTAQTQPHITDPRKESGYLEADCLNNSGVVKYCFCGAVSEKIDEENTALGHEFNLENGAKILSLTYTNYFANGDKSTKCARCDVTEETKADAIIIDFKGFSTKEDGNGITFGYYLDEKALVLFESVNKFKLEFGFVVAVKDFVNGNAPLNADGTAAETTQGSVIKAVASSQTANYSGYDFKLTGTWDKMVDLDGDNVAETDIKDVEFYMAGYVFDGTVSYIQSETATSATVTAFAYNDIK